MTVATKCWRTRGLGKEAAQSATCLHHQKRWLRCKCRDRQGATGSFGRLLARSVLGVGETWTSISALVSDLDIAPIGLTHQCLFRKSGLCSGHRAAQPVGVGG